MSPTMLDLDRRSGEEACRRTPCRSVAGTAVEAGAGIEYPATNL